MFHHEDLQLVICLIIPRKTMKKTNNRISFITSLFLQFPNNQTKLKEMKNENCLYPETKLPKKIMKKTNNKVSFILYLFLQFPNNQTKQKGIKKWKPPLFENKTAQKNDEKRQITRFHESLLFSFNFLAIKWSKKVWKTKTPFA